MNRWNGKKGSSLLLKCALDKKEQAPISHMFEMCSQLRCLLPFAVYLWSFKSYIVQYENKIKIYPTHQHSNRHFYREAVETTSIF